MVQKFDFRGTQITYDWNWLDDDTFVFQFGDGEFKDLESDYFIHFEYHVDDDEWVVEIWWEDDSIGIDELDKIDADEYITKQEIKEIKALVEQLMK